MVVCHAVKGMTLVGMTLGFPIGPEVMTLSSFKEQFDQNNYACTLAVDLE